jgi:hypothetical protein
MDFSKAEQKKGKGLNRTRFAAFAFLLLAGALFVASLLTTPEGLHGPQNGAPGTTALIR